MKIALVSCTKLKHDYDCQAQEMYMPSKLFSKARKYIERKEYDKWFILSAKYGLLDPTELISTYNQTLNNMKSSDVKGWAKEVHYKLSEYKITEVDFYAGEKYRKYLIPLLEERGIVCSVPLKGLGIGQQLSFYTKYLKEVMY